MSVSIFLYRVLVTDSDKLNTSSSGFMCVVSFDSSRGTSVLVSDLEMKKAE